MNSNQKDFEIKKNALLVKFESENRDIDDGSRDKAFEDLCVELLKLQYGLENPTEEDVKKITAFAKLKMSNMECEDPRLAHAVNGLRRIGQSRYGDASKYVEELEKANKETFSKIQSKHASNPKKDTLNELIKSYLRFTPEMTANELLLRLKGDIGNGVVDEIDDEDIYYFPTTGKDNQMPISTKVSGLKNRLSRIKKISNKNRPLAG
jgi:hypothetical protein